MKERKIEKQLEVIEQRLPRLFFQHVAEQATERGVAHPWRRIGRETDAGLDDLLGQERRIAMARARSMQAQRECTPA